jgi:hypothetical protein
VSREESKPAAQLEPDTLDDQRLDAALEMTFPASDALAVSRRDEGKVSNGVGS